MVDRVSKQKRSKIMAAIHSKNTKPEITLRKALWSNGFRYRIHYGNEKIDIAFPSKKLAIFVDGCFWHGCPLHSHIPKSNIEYWQPKLKKNKQRDINTTRNLENKGWQVVRFWEHEIQDIASAIMKIRSTLNSLNKP